MDSLSQMLRATAHRRPDAPALRAASTSVTWAQLAGAVETVAGGLHELGMRRGDRLGMILPNCPQFVITYFATVRLGAIAVPVNPLLAPVEVAYIAQDAGMRMMVAAEHTAPLAQAAAAQCPALEQLVVVGETVPDGAVDFAALMAARPGEMPEPGAGEDVAALLYTSGTTGRPKGAMLTHRNLIANAAACVEAIDVCADDIFLAVLPLFHSFGATVCMITPVLAGCAAVLVPRFEPLPVLEVIERERVTIFAGVPSMFAWLAGLKGAPSFDTSSLRLCISGGAPLPIEIVEPFEARYQTTLVEGYGPTEASPVVSVNRSLQARKLGSVGPPLPGVEVRICDDEGRDLPPGEVGEVWVRGPNVMKGYWRAPEQTAETMRAGWLLTGDLGRVDEDGYLYIVDRKKDLIIVGGLNVYPREVEDVIRRLPEVRDCAVIGVRSPMHGERVKAFIELHEGQSLDTERVLTHCHEHLARYKVPRALEVVDALPRSATGKVLKRELRARESGSR
ncbi:MAG: long-chain fatty acid--CoA ligase [Armatimonadota bacterium]